MAAIVEDVAQEATRYETGQSMLSNKIAQMVQGKGYVGEHGVKPTTDARENMADACKAEMALKEACTKSENDPRSIVSSLDPGFMSQFGRFMRDHSPQQDSMMRFREEVQQAFADLGKNITLTSPLSSGFVPYNLV